MNLDVLINKMFESGKTTELEPKVTERQNSHLPFRRREYAIPRFRKEETLQKFTSIYAQIYNHFNGERHLVNRQIFRKFRSDAIAEWRTFLA